MRVDLVDEDGHPISEEGYAGEIVINGDSVALGYVNGREPLVDEFQGRRVATGDLGIILSGQLYVIERIKNIIIRNGENFLVSAIELDLARILGVSHDNVAVFETDIFNPQSPIVVLVEKHQGLSEDQAYAFLGELPVESYPVDQILFSRRRTIPRTTSGKKRHFYCRQLFQQNELEYQIRVDVTPDRLAQFQPSGGN